MPAPISPSTPVTESPAPLTPRFRHLLLRILVFPFVIVATLSGLLLWQLDRRADYGSWVDHTDEVIALANRAMREFYDAQSAYRGYLIDGKPVREQRTTEAFNAAQSDLAQLANLVGDNPLEVERVGQLRTMTSGWKTNAERMIAARKAGQDVVSLFAADQGVADMTNMGRTFEDLLAEEHRLRTTRSAMVRKADTLLTIYILAGVAGLSAMLSFFGWREIDHLSREYSALLLKEQTARRETDELRQQAEAANLAKDQFLGVISHELRNPLSSIMLWSRLLRSDGIEPEKMRRGLEVIERNVKSQAQLIEDILDVSRIASGKMRLDVRATELATVLEAALETIRPAVEAKRIRLETVIDPRAGLVAGDSERLQQVFWNLLSNAVKFTPAGGKIQVRLERINSHLEITVSDNGQGIEPAILPRIFDRFWQASAGASHENSGLGLGLSIVRHIIELHGGSVTAHSDGHGKGAILRVRLPLMATMSSDGSQLRRHPTVSDELWELPATELDGVSVLVVDDEEDASLVVASLLMTRGAQVRSANSAEDALRIVESWRPDVIVSDIEMPTHDGLWLINQMRSRGVTAPAAALTAYGRVDDRIRILDAGFQMHITKPVDSSELLAVISALARQRAAESLA